MTTAAVALLAIAPTVAVSGCGKPQYCSDRSNLEQSVKGIGDVKLLQSGGLKNLQAQLQKVESDARALAGSAKSDFASQTKAIESSVSTLKTDVQQLPSSPTPAQLSRVVSDVKAVGTAFGDFKDATSSKCS